MRKIRATKTGKIVLISLSLAISIMLVSAALLSHYGEIRTTANVQQSIVLSDDGTTWYNWDEPIIRTFDIVAGGCQTYYHWIHNRAPVSGDVDIFTSGVSPGIDVHYEQRVKYAYAESIELNDGNDLEITVEEDGEWMVFSFNFPVEDWIGDGQISLGLIIATDGLGEGPVFQIHNNDGADATYPWGTWLMSPWGPTIDDGWHGWHSGSDNTPVEDLWWVEASGERYAQGTDGVLQVKIHKLQLGDTFHWAGRPTVGSGWFAPVITEYLKTPSTFEWNEPIVTADNYHEANFWEELTSPFTLVSNEFIHFRIRYCFNIAIMPGEYTIESWFIPSGL